MNATVTAISAARGRTPKKFRIPSITSLAKAGDDDWDMFFKCCAEVADEGTVEILHCGSPDIHAKTHQRIRAIEAVVRHPNGSEAYALFHIGVKGDAIFTGYSNPAKFRDYYRVRLPDGRIFASKLWWSGNTSGLVYQSWCAVAPVKMAVWCATYARLLDGRPLAG